MSFLTPELVFNVLGIALSFIALYYWLMLYKKIQRKANEFKGWFWLFAAAFAILLLNLSSAYLAISGSDPGATLDIAGRTIDFQTFQVMEVLSRTIIVFSMTVGIYLIYHPLKSGFVYALKPVGLTTSAPLKEKLTYNLEQCMSYLIPESKGDSDSKTFDVADRSSANSMHVFTNLISHGAYGLIITREYPGNVRKNWDVDTLPIIWLSTSGDKKEDLKNVEYVSPVDLIGLSHAIKNFISNSENTIVLLDGFEYIMSQNSFEEALKFLQSLDDVISQTKSRLIVSIDYKALDEKQVHILKRELCELTID